MKNLQDKQGRPLVSFITATWNVVKAGRADALVRCLKSTVDCPFPSEHIVIDGGSTDGTVPLLEQNVSEGRWISEPDHGIYDALNKGVKMARGEWISVLGCDDYICDAAALARAIAHADADLVVAPVERGFPLRTINMKACLYSIPYCHQGLLARRHIFDLVGGFDPRYKLLSDYKFALACLLRNLPHKITKEKFAFYASGGASSTWGGGAVEGAAIAREFFGLTPTEEDRLCRENILPIRICLRYLFHRNRYVRRSAVYSMIKSIAISMGVKR